MRRRGFWVALAALTVGVVLLAAGCGSSSSNNSSGGAGGSTAIPPHKTGGTITVALSGNVDYLDPALAYYQSSWQIEYSTCVKLTNYKDLAGDAGHVIYPEAASAMPTVSSDGLTYTYTVPPGRFKFNTGEPVTAQSFQHALERDLNPIQASYFGSVFLKTIDGSDTFKGKPGEHVSGISVSGDKLIIKLNTPDAGLISKLTTPFACAVSKDTAIDSKGVHAPAGAGPYYIASYTPNRSIVLKKNPNWTDAAGYHRPAYADEIDYTSLTENTDQGTLQIRNGQLDYSPDALSPAQYFQLNKEFGPKGTWSGGYERFFITPGAIVSYMALNVTRPAFANPLVRQAVNYAIDRPAISQTSGYGASIPAEKYLPPQIAGSAEEKVVYPVDGPDLTKAKELMQQAGVTTPITAVLYTCNQPPCPDRAAVIQANLKAIGINVEVKQFDRGVQFGKEGTKGEPFDIADEGWIADYYDAYDFLNILLDGSHIPATNGNDFSYINDPTLNKALEDANKLTGDARNNAYGAVATGLKEPGGLAPWAPRSFGTNIDFFGPKVGCQVNQGSYGMALNSFCIRS
jgi:peptide/nickel transport system substrate-binding protein